MENNNTTYHDPVLLHESIDGLAIKPGGVYVDVTFGGGGHTREILSRLTEGARLISFDQDADAVVNANAIDDENFTLIEGNFRFLKRYLRSIGVKKVDGILGDLGISSHQINTAERGFSFRYDAPLDMRMDASAAISAESVVNEYDTRELHRILGMYGEVKNAKTLADAIVKERCNQPITTTQDLRAVLEQFAPRNRENRYFAQVFQAIRIEVNEELKVLEDFLEQSAEVLNEDGRLSVISYHSLEDRLVKNYIQKGKFSGEVEKDFYGNEIKPLKAINRKPIVATEDEIEKNKRARSAKLRVASRTAHEWDSQ